MSLKNLHKRLLEAFHIHTFINLDEKPKSPRKQLGHIFDAVQLSRTFRDSKIFVDAIPNKKISKIQKEYQKISSSQLNFAGFVKDNFILPESILTSKNIQKERLPIRDHLTAMWKELTRESDKHTHNSSLLALPYEYIVPGGRFREIYYWDSYFTMLGLREEGNVELIESMIKNFAYLIDTYGFIANGNRTYYLTRSQPPVFGLMVEMLAEIKGEAVYTQFLPQILKEYEYWMRGQKSSEFKNKVVTTKDHVVRMSDGEILNRYWDESISPREESFIEDVETGTTIEKSSDFYRNMRAGAESGWDFSSRWFRDVHDKTSIRTTDIVPIDLNILLLRTEEIIEHIFNLQQSKKHSARYAQLADNRRDAIRKYLWNEENGWYFDYVISEQAISTQLTIAGMFALFGGVANAHQATQMSTRIRNEFLRTGGIATTFINSGEQWDAPNGWAPMHYVSIVGLERYGNHTLAEDIATRWCNMNLNIYEKTGLLFEKYDIENPEIIAGGGEYTIQTGYGWTNGVLLYLLNKYHIN